MTANDDDDDDDEELRHVTILYLGSCSGRNDRKTTMK